MIWDYELYKYLSDDGSKSEDDIESEPIDIPTLFNFEKSYAIQFIDEGDFLYKLVPNPTTQEELDALIEKYMDVYIVYGDSNEELLEKIEQLNPRMYVGIYCDALKKKPRTKEGWQALNKAQAKSLSPEEYEFNERTIGIEYENLDELLNSIEP